MSSSSSPWIKKLDNDKDIKLFLVYLDEKLNRIQDTLKRIHTEPLIDEDTQRAIKRIRYQVDNPFLEDDEDDADSASPEDLIDDELREILANDVNK